MPMYNLDPNDTRPLAEQFSDVMDYLDEVYNRDTTGDAPMNASTELYPGNDVDSYLPEPRYRYEEIYSDTVDDLIIGYEVYAPGNDSDQPDRIEYDPAYLPDPELPIPHYHVLSSMAGYLPDYNEIHDTRDQAREDAAWYVEAYDDMNASSDEYPEYYDIDARDPDYIVVGRGGPDSYAMPIIVEVVECLDHTCEREEN